MKTILLIINACLLALFVGCNGGDDPPGRTGGGGETGNFNLAVGEGVTATVTYTENGASQTMDVAANGCLNAHSDVDKVEAKQADDATGTPTVVCEAGTGDGCTGSHKVVVTGEGTTATLESQQATADDFKDKTCQTLGTAPAAS